MLNSEVLGRTMEYKGLEKFIDQQGNFIKDVPEKITRACPLCGSTVSTVLFKIAIFPIVECSVCRFVYNQEILEPRFLQSIHYTWYNLSNRNNASKRYYEINGKTIKKQKRYYYSFFKEIRKKSDLSKGSFLDIGANIGISLKQAGDVGYEAFGVEMDSNYCRFAKQRFGLDLINKKIEDVVFDRKFDLIRINHVLEHVLYPLDILKHIYKILKKGGLLFVGVPNMNSFSVGFLMERHRFYQPIHINHFTQNSLIKMLTKVGSFKVVFNRTLGFRPLTIIFQNYNMTLDGKYLGDKRTFAMRLILKLIDGPFEYLNKKGFFRKKGDLLELLLMKTSD